MKFSMVFAGIDKATKVMKKVMAADKKTSAAMKATNNKAARSTAKLQKANKKLERSFSGIGRGSARGFGLVKRGADGVKAAFRGVQTMSGKAFKAIVKGSQKAWRGIKKLHEKTKQLAKTGFNDVVEGAGKLKRGAVVAGGIFASIYASVLPNSLSA